MEEGVNNNNKPLINPVDDFSEREIRILKRRLLALAIERRVKNIYQGLKNKFWLA